MKEKPLFQLTNGGNPFDLRRRTRTSRTAGELLLRYDHQGLDLRQDYAKEVMRSILRIWKRLVNATTIAEGQAQ